MSQHLHHLLFWPGLHTHARVIPHKKITRSADEKGVDDSVNRGGVPLVGSARHTPFAEWYDEATGLCCLLWRHVTGRSPYRVVRIVRHIGRPGFDSTAVWA